MHAATVCPCSPSQPTLPIGLARRLAGPCNRAGGKRPPLTDRKWPGVPVPGRARKLPVTPGVHQGNRPASILMAGRHAGRFDQISVCSAISRASSTSMPRYRTVDSSLWTAVHRLDYLRCRPMSRDVGDLRAARGRSAGHRPEGYSPFKKSSNLSSGRYRPGWPVGGVVRSRTRCFNSRSASRYI